MPTYEYACTDCGTHVEVVQGMGAPPLETCGVCGGPLRKVFHPAGILFKGSGFYATDYKRAAGTTEKADHKAEKAEKAEKADKPAESKPQPKKDSSSDK